MYTSLRFGFTASEHQRYARRCGFAVSRCQFRRGCGNAVHPVKVIVHQIVRYRGDEPAVHHTRKSLMMRRRRELGRAGAVVVQRERQAQAHRILAAACETIIVVGKRTVFIAHDDSENKTPYYRSKIALNQLHGKPESEKKVRILTVRLTDSQIRISVCTSLRAFGARAEKLTIQTIFLLIASAICVYAASDILVPAVVPPPAYPNVWAVLIGVDDYRDPGIPDLSYAGRDARTMLGALGNAYSGATVLSAELSPAGENDTGSSATTVTPAAPSASANDSDDNTLAYNRSHSLVLAKGGDGAPTAANVRFALQTWLPARAKRGDLAVVFLSGHGVPLKDDSSPDGVRRYFITSDANANKLATTALSMDEIAKYVACLPCEHVVTFIDACFSGSKSGKGLAGTTARGDRFWRNLASATGKVVITACAYNEQSVEVAELESGLFTYYVAEGFTGFADENRDGILSIAELYQYIRSHVQIHASRLGVRQSPQAAAVSQTVSDYAILTTREFEDKLMAREEAETEAEPDEGYGGYPGNATGGTTGIVSADSPSPPPPPSALSPEPSAVSVLNGVLDISLDYELSYAHIERVEPPTGDDKKTDSDDEEVAQTVTADYGANPLPLCIELPDGEYRITIGALGRLEKVLAITVTNGEAVSIADVTLEIDPEYKPSAPDDDLADKLDIVEVFKEKEN